MLTKIQALLEKTKLNRLINGETIRYAFWGVATTVLNIGVYRILLALGVPYASANLAGIITAKVAAFFVNKFFVFRSRTEGAKALFIEIFRYIYTRGFTLLVDYFGLILLVGVLGGDEKYMKYITTFVVVVINYVLGKFLVFRKNRQTAEPKEEEA